MFVYDKKLQYPVKIDKPNPKLASIIISQYAVRMESWGHPFAICLKDIPCPSTN